MDSKRVRLPRVPWHSRKIDKRDIYGPAVLGTPLKLKVGGFHKVNSVNFKKKFYFCSRKKRRHEPNKIKRRNLDPPLDASGHPSENYVNCITQTDFKLF